jgi:hypothetical protein
VLLSIDGKVKIGNFSHCKKQQPGISMFQSLGRLVMEMMDRNVFLVASLAGKPPVLQNPERWSNAANNFVNRSLWASLDDLANVSRLQSKFLPELLTKRCSTFF